MKNGFERFEFYLEKTESILLQAANEKNAGLWLFENDLRTPLFMLEGLAKLYAGLHNEKRFARIKEEFKLLEDALGMIDYYDGFAKEFSNRADIPDQIKEYIQAQTREKVQRLNDLLQERKWTGDHAVRFEKIRKKLKNADWQKEKEEVKGIAGFYQESIEEIRNFISGIQYNFTEIETQVHSLRRKLRWLSIYPKALQGVIQLTDHQPTDENLSKYLTEDIVNSPFIKMPEAGNNTTFLMLEKNYFISLSWIISKLGKLKDNGLRILVVEEAIRQIKGTGKPESLALAYMILGEKQDNMQAILLEASTVCNTWFKEGNLDKLLSSIVKI